MLILVSQGKYTFLCKEGTPLRILAPSQKLPEAPPVPLSLSTRKIFFGENSGLVTANGFIPSPLDSTQTYPAVIYGGRIRKDASTV